MQTLPVFALALFLFDFLLFELLFLVFYFSTPADWSRKYLQEKEAQIKENQIKKEQVQKQVEFAKVQSIIQERCVSCHSDKPTFSGIVAPPAGISYDKSEDILLNVEKIYQQVVISKIMPLGNITQMTQEERDAIAQWYINQK